MIGLPIFPSPDNGFSVSLDLLTDLFPVLEELGSVPQDPLYHGEGDVLTHTKMVLEALTADDRWQRLSETERSELWLAALFHDLGKLRTTSIDADGRISSPNHSAVGARETRQLFYRHDRIHLPFTSRERIVNFIRHHTLPIWFLDRSDPRRHLLLVSQTIPLEALYLLAVADIQGRINARKEETLAGLELFREYTREENCLTDPYPFCDSFSRYAYAHDQKRAPDFPVFDDSDMEVVLMSGLPGAGKDSWIKQHADGLEVVSLDKIRRKMKVSPGDNQGRVVQQAREEARVFLRKKQSFIWNATNITRALRESLINLFRDYRARVKIVYIECPYAELLRRNAAREHSLPEKDLIKLVAKLEVPLPHEAHEVLYVT